MATPSIFHSDLLGPRGIAAILNEQSLQAEIDSLYVQYKAGDENLTAAVANLRADTLAWIAAIPPGTAPSAGLTRTELEGILSDLLAQPAFQAASASKTAVIGGETVTLTSALEAVTIRRPVVTLEVFASGADRLPTGQTVSFADGRQSVFAVTRTDTGSELVFAFASTDYLGLPASFEIAVGYTVTTSNGHTVRRYAEARISRVLFDLSPFLVAGVDVLPVNNDLDANGTNDGSTPAAPVDPVTPTEPTEPTPADPAPADPAPADPAPSEPVIDPETGLPI